MAKIAEHKANPWIITDFETGGVELHKDAITEIAMQAIRGDTLEEIGRYESLIKPYDANYDEKAFEKTGLSLAKLEKEGKPFATVVKEVTEFLKSANVHNNTTQYKPVLVAHNAPFEVQCFQHLFQGAEKELEKLLQGSWDFHKHFIPAYLDTMQIGRMLLAANIRVKSFSLETICEQVGVPVADGHRAMNDVLPTGEFLKHAIKALRAAEAGSAVGVDKELSFRNNFYF